MTMISLEGEAVSVMHTANLEDDHLVLIALDSENVCRSIHANVLLQNIKEYLGDGSRVIFS